MLFSVIIPTCQRNETLILCLERLSPDSQKLSSHQFEVIVTDDGPNEDAKSLIRKRFPWVKYTIGHRKGPAANRNNGARIASGKWLVFTDDDCLPDANWLQAFSVAINEHSSCKAFEGAILPDNWSLLKIDMAECPVNKDGGCFWSANIMVEKELFWQVSGFDECFKIAAQEDQDLKIRLERLTSILFIPASIVTHPVRIVKLHDRITMIEKQSYNWVKFIRKHYKEKQRVKLINGTIILHAKGSLNNLFSFNFQKALYHVAAIKFIIGNRNKLIKASRDNYIKHN